MLNYQLSKYYIVKHHVAKLNSRLQIRFVFVMKYSFLSSIIQIFIIQKVDLIFIYNIFFCFFVVLVSQFFLSIQIMFNHNNDNMIKLYLYNYNKLIRFYLYYLIVTIRLIFF